MATTRQLSFAAGEVSPSLYGRVDTIKYATGVRQMRNFFSMRHGGAANRPGTRFVCEAKDSSKKVKLIPFIFNKEQTYVLEFGDQYMRVIRDAGKIEVSGLAAWAAPTTYAQGDLVEHLGVNYYSRVDANTGNAPNSSPSEWYALTGDIFEIPTPYLEAELPELQFVQSADVITLAHPNHAPAELARTADTGWTLKDINFFPDIAAPTNPNVVGSAGSKVFVYHITSISAEDFEESLAAVASGTSLADPSLSTPHTVTWTEEPDAQEYSVYLEVNGVPGFVGVAQGGSFVNDGIDPDTTDTPPTARNPFDGVGNFPSTVAYYQQRLVFANTDNNPERTFTSRTAQFNNFTTSRPLQDDDAVTFTLVGRQVNEIRHLIELGTLVVFTTGGEWSIRGNEAGVLLPTAVNPKQHSYNGSGLLPPLIVGGNAVYLQARGSIVRDLAFDFAVDGYRGNDLTIFSAHLFDAFTMEEWAYQQIPHSIIWMVRSDGTLLGMTYVREHELLAWHRHDTDGLFEGVAVVPEGNEDSLYVVVNRTVDGQEKRYIERMESRIIDEGAIEDSIFVDSSLSYDGRNTSSTTMTLSGGPPWTAGTSLTLTASASTFVAGDVGNEIHLRDNGSLVRCEIVGFSSGTSVTVKPDRDVPASLQGVAVTTWSKAVDEFSGLDHLEGKSVSVFGDGFVVASPNNDEYDEVTVSGGSVTLDRPYAVVHIGLPYTSDIETLDIDSTSGETLMDKKKLITNVSMFVETTRGVFVGAVPPQNEGTGGLDEHKLRDDESMDVPPALKTEVIDVNIRSEWNSNGRVFVRQVDPIPAAILTIAPAGYVPFSR